MKTRNVALLAFTLALTVLILSAGVYVVIASPVPSIATTSVPAAVASSETEWGSGWISIAQGELLTLNHNLGALGLPPERYALEMWFQDTDGTLGINRRYYGGVEINGDPDPWRGAHWQNLTTNTVQVYRALNDTAVDMVSVRVWVVPPAVPPDGRDSGWIDILPNQTITFHHNLWITATDLTVGLWFSHPIRGINHFAYGGLTIDPVTGTQGAFWHHLTNNIVRVTRYPSDSAVSQVRVTVVHGASPTYDSEWQSVAQDQKLTLPHNLNWNTDMLLARGECQSLGLGIHQRSAGGDHVGTPPGALWVGANMENLTTNTVQVYRRGEDMTCPEFRVRIWKRSKMIYLPIVMRDYSAP